MEIVEKVWGNEVWVVNNELYCFKRLTLKKNYQCSLHCHKIKDETFIIEEGEVTMECDDKNITMRSGDKIRIKPNEYHRFTGITDSVILEISTTHSDEDSYRKTESGKVNV